MRGGRADVSFRDVTIARDGKQRLVSANDVTHREHAEDFWRFWKSQWVEMSPASGEDGWFLLARGDLWGQVPNVLARGRWKSQKRKIVPLSPYVEEPLNTKVIKSFVPEQRSRQVFFVFRDSYVLSLWTFDVRFTHSYIMAMVQFVTKRWELPSLYTRIILKIRWIFSMVMEIWHTIYAKIFWGDGNQLWWTLSLSEGYKYDLLYGTQYR